jgi:hypothetical protein
LWFDDQAEAVATFYTAIFRRSRIVHVARYGDVGREVHGKPPGTVMIVAFELEGQRSPPSTAVRSSPSTKPSRSRSLARRRPTWIIIGTSDEEARYCGTDASVRRSVGCSP